MQWSRQVLGMFFLGMKPKLGVPILPEKIITFVSAQSYHLQGVSFWIFLNCVYYKIIRNLWKFELEKLRFLYKILSSKFRVKFEYPLSGGYERKKKKKGHFFVLCCFGLVTIFCLLGVGDRDGEWDIATSPPGGLNLFIYRYCRCRYLCAGHPQNGRLHLFVWWFVWLACRWWHNTKQQQQQRQRQQQ